ncbi:MAG TPA: hypothetical protein PKE26_04560 [Kiritimatiellia bacterium]|nr:hypothetical protein [Kiritimatiellia bacterium]
MNAHQHKPTGATTHAALRAHIDGLFADMRLRLEHQHQALLLCLDGLEGASTDASAIAGQRKLLEAVRETVDVLEQTKRSFKSKRLGELREKLERVLTEAGQY